MGQVQNGAFISAYLGDQIDLLLAAMAQANPLPSGQNWIAFIDDCRAAQTAAQTAAANADTAKNAAAGSASTAAQKATEAGQSASAAAQKANAASGSASTAAQKASEAAASASAANANAAQARSSASSAEAAKNTAQTNAVLAKSYAVGATGERAGENTDNAAYYARLAASWSAFPPYIDATTGNWMVYSVSLSRYVDSGVHAQGATGPQGPQGIQGPPGPQGINGVSLGTNGFVSFTVNASGILVCTYSGDQQPDFSIDQYGHLVLDLDDGSHYDLGHVVGPRGPQGVQGPAGPQGINGVAVQTEGYVAFNVTAAGILQCTYSGVDQPNYSINSSGHLVYTF